MEQTPSPSILPTILAGFAALATFLGIPLTYLFTRRKQKADVSQVNAETHKTEAETRQIDSAIALRAFERLDDLELIIDELRIERRADKKKLEDMEWRYGMLEVQLKKAVATLKLHNIIWDETA